MTRLLSILISLTVIAAAAPLSAQSPFGPTPATPVGPPPALDPASPATPPGPAFKEDPVVRAFRNRNPKTPHELMEAAVGMINYGRLDEALNYLKTLVALAPDRDALLQLQREFGADVFLKLRRTAELQPAGAQLASVVGGAFEDAARDQTRLAGMVDQLSDPSLGVRSAALRGLQDAQLRAVEPMLKALADEGRAEKHASIRAAFAALKLENAEPLLGALEAPDAALRTNVIRVLGAMRAREATEYLVEPYHAADRGPAEQAAARDALLRIIGSLPNRAQSEQFLRKRTNDYLGGMLPSRLDIDDMVTIWHWDNARQSTVPRRYLPHDASLVAATRTARDLNRLVAGNPEYLRMYLLAALEADKMIGGVDNPLRRGPGTAHASASAAGVVAVEDALASALAGDKVAAAIAAIEVLADIGDARLVDSSDGRPRPIARALQHGDRRLRLTAAATIVDLAPTRDFPGSSRVLETLAFVAGTIGLPRALVADPRPEVAQTLAGMLGELGYEADTAFSGRQTIRMLQGEADYAFVLLSAWLDRPRAAEAYDMLRNDVRTARLPIGFVALPDQMDHVGSRADEDPLCHAFNQPRSTRGLAYEIRQMLSEEGRFHLNEEQRIAQANAALTRLIHLGEHRGRYPFYDLQRVEGQVEKALFTPGLSESAARMLGLLASPRAQLALVDRASQNASDLAGRQAAAEAFANAVSRRGILLTASVVKLQYDRYNLSESLDVETQQVLGSILDAIESKVREK